MASTMPWGGGMRTQQHQDFTPDGSSSPWLGNILSAGYDVVFDTSGALPVTTAMRMLTKTGVFLDINATPAKFLHSSLHRRRHKIFFCSPTTQILTDAAAAAVAGDLRMPVGETVSLETAIGLITDLENGRKIPGKGLILLDTVPGD